MEHKRRSKGGRYARPQPKQNHIPLYLGLLGGAAALILVVVLCVKLASGPSPAPQPSLDVPPTATATQETEAPTLPPVQEPVSTATIGVMGDLLIHKPIIQAAATEGGGYDFSPIFQHLEGVISPLDYAIANLETTLGGPSAPYQGNPLFNCPDEILPAVQSSGFDMLLTANNHCADTWAEGIIRTAQQVRAQGLENLGTGESAQDPKFSVVDVAGIQIGMVCYTYATGVTADGRPQFNYNAYVSQAGLVNFFLESNLEDFYAKAQENLDSMKNAGAETAVIYLHWGKEYDLVGTETQKAMAQRLCDMGYDAIIGGHPHVVEPMDLLTSTQDPSHKTVVIYSLGNAVSNQRKENMRLDTGHTEDGVLFTLTFEKYPDGTVAIADTDVVPTWVTKDYQILPLVEENQSQWQSGFGLDDTAFAQAQSSFQRTMEIVGPGLRKCQEFLSSARQARISPQT